jgi:hypothetical protein
MPIVRAIPLRIGQLACNPVQASDTGILPGLVGCSQTVWWPPPGRDVQPSAASTLLTSPAANGPRLGRPLGFLRRTP